MEVSEETVGNLIQDNFHYDALPINTFWLVLQMAGCIPALIGKEEGYTLDISSVYHKANIDRQPYTH